MNKLSMLCFYKSLCKEKSVKSIKSIRYSSQPACWDCRTIESTTVYYSCTTMPSVIWKTSCIMPWFLYIVWRVKLWAQVFSTYITKYLASSLFIMQ